MITPERWRRVQELCERLEAEPEAARAATLQSLEADPEVRRETLALLDALRDEEAAQQASAPEPAVMPPRPEQVAGVRVLERLGAGGSGEVYRGVRVVNGTEQPVAVKLFHAHRADAEHRARIAREQQMLATLTHPDIVGLLDAGVTADGRPFLVMELVEGEPFTDYCDARRLRLPERLRLFLAVCDAVQSAHRQLIVHLDLKPANILVAGDGRVKLLDFGAAKLADPAVGFTRTEPLTLRYASPERLRGEPVSVACDVYSAGLILYELLSGAWPYRMPDSLMAVAERAAGHLEVVPLPGAVTEDAADRRSMSVDRLRGALRGDLEAIVARALAHEPAARYASVSALAEDLRRHLAGEPVHAQARGLGYRFGKFVRRRRWEVAAMLLLVAGLAGAAVYSAAQARAARDAAVRLETQNRFLTSVFTLAGNDRSSSHDMTVRQLLALAEQRIAPSLGDQPVLANDVEITLAQGYISQNAYPEARRLLERVVERAGTHADVAHEADARARLAFVAFVQSDTPLATTEARAALALWRAHPARFSPAQAMTTLRIAASTLSYVAITDPDTARSFDDCLDLARRHPDAASPADRGVCLRGLAIAYMNVESRYDEADALLRQAAALQRADPGAMSDLATTLQILGLTNRYRGRYAEDEAAQRESWEILSQLQGPDSVAALWQRAVWATSLAGAGDAVEAFGIAQEVLAAGRRLYPARGSYLLWTPLIAAASSACLSGKNDECEALATEAIETLGPTPAENDPRLHGARGMVGLVLARRGRMDEARPLIERALAMEAARKRTSPYTALWQAALSAPPVAR